MILPSFDAAGRAICGKRDVLRSLGEACDQTGILLTGKSPWESLTKRSTVTATVARKAVQREALVAQRHVQRAP